MAAQRKGLVLGIYEGTQEGEFTFTKSAEKYQAAKAQSLKNLIEISGLANKKGKCRIFYDLDPDYSGVAVVRLGKKGAGYNEIEDLDEGRENIRNAVAAGCMQLNEAGIRCIEVDTCGDPEAAAEGAILSVFCYDDLKKEKKPCPEMTCFSTYAENPDSVKSVWQRGAILAQGQNVCRRIMEAPANIMTPTRFAEFAEEHVGKLDKCEVRVRDKAWAESMKMGSFLSVAQGSEEPPKFVEMEYKGGKEGDAPFALVGKGVTFDSGGISLKPSPMMDQMRADMGGGACVLGSVYTAARLNIPINLIGLVPLTENMPSGKATKPGDVHTAMNGKTIQIDNTDAEGRLILADALCYAETFKPSAIVNMATLTGAMVVALGPAATGVYATDKGLWELLQKAGSRTGDRMWRMPLFKMFTKTITESQLADVNNIGSMGRAGGACTAAAFLREFVTHDKWMHLDIAGVMDCKSEIPYLPKGMTGRPTRTIAEFLNLVAKQSTQ